MLGYSPHPVLQNPPSTLAILHTTRAVNTLPAAAHTCTITTCQLVSDLKFIFCAGETHQRLRVKCALHYDEALSQVHDLEQPQGVDGLLLLFHCYTNTAVPSTHTGHARPLQQYLHTMYRTHHTMTINDQPQALPIQQSTPTALASNCSLAALVTAARTK